MSAGAVRVISTWGQLTVALTAASGTTPAVYSDEARTAPISLPATVADGAISTFYFASPGSYLLSVKTSSGTEIAADANSQRAITVTAGGLAVFQYDTRLLAEIAGDSGRSAPPAGGGGGGGLAYINGVTNVALINGSQDFFTYTTPNDGKPHLLQVAAVQTASSPTGGGVTVTFTEAGIAKTVSVISTGQNGTVTGSLFFGSRDCYADPNTLVTVKQNAALTAGTATLNAAHLWAA